MISAKEVARLRARFREAGVVLVKSIDELIDDYAAERQREAVCEAACMARSDGGHGGRCGNSDGIALSIGEAVIKAVYESDVKLKRRRARA